jgi:hypothetical protein
MAREFTVTVRGSEVRFTSTNDDQQAIAKLRSMIRPGGALHQSSFAVSLSVKHDRYGSLYPNQMAWVHKLVVDAESPAPAGVDADLSGIVRLFDHAAKNLKYPAITVVLHGVTIRLKLAGPSSKHAGNVFVTNDERWPNQTYFGRIQPDGSFVASRQATDQIRKTLVDLSADPAKFAAEYGKLSGRCCFCNTALTDERSTVQGYGPVCAKKWNLPWGVRPANPANIPVATLAEEVAEATLATVE